VPVESEKQALGRCVTFFDAHTGRNSDSNHGSWGIERIVALALPPARAMQTTHGNWVDIRHAAPYHTRRRVLQTYLADQFKHRYTPLYINLNVMLACSNHSGTYLHAQYLPLVPFFHSNKAIVLPVKQGRFQEMECPATHVVTPASA